MTTRDARYTISGTQAFRNFCTCFLCVEDTYLGILHCYFYIYFNNYYSLDENWDEDEYVPQPIRLASDGKMCEPNKNSYCTRGRGNLRGRVSSGKINFNESSRGRGRPRREKVEEDRDSNARGPVRGFGRGRSNSRGDALRNPEKASNDKFNHGRGRGRSFRMSRSSDRRIDDTNDEENDNIDKDQSENNDREERRRTRTSTPPRGVRGRTRSSCGRISSDIIDKKEKLLPRGRGRVRGRSQNMISRSDGEESDKSDEGKSHRGRAAFNRSKSFRGTSYFSGKP